MRSLSLFGRRSGLLCSLTGPPTIARVLKNTLLALAGLVSVLGLATCFFITRGPRDLRDKRLHLRARVDLDGVATVALPPTFRAAGVVNSGERGWLGGDLTTLEYHLDEKLLSFRFEQGQHNTLGGYSADPVILDVTLFNGAVDADEISRITSTTIDRFYSPTGQTSFAAVPWLPDVTDGPAVTKSAEVADGMGASNPRRWLIINTDPVRRVRVDFFAWKKAYELTVAQTLIRDIARSVSATPALQTHFDEIKTFDQRMAAKRDRLIEEIAKKMAGCALPSPIGGLQGRPSERSVEDNPAIPAVTARLTNRADVHLFRFKSYDVLFRPDLVDVEDFLRDSDWYEAGLVEGKILPGIRVTKADFPP